MTRSISNWRRFFTKMKNSKSVILFGGRGLIGSCILELLTAAENIERVVSVDLKENEDDSFPSNHYVNGTHVEHQRIDVTNEEMLNEYFYKLKNDYANTHNTVINATYPRPSHWGKPINQISMLEFNNSFAAALGSFFLIARATGDYFVDRNIEGTHIGFSSIYGTMAPRFEVYEGTNMNMPVEYAGIKGAINQINRYFASYYKTKGITYNLISPGGVYNNQDPIFVENYEKYTGRVGMISGQDVAQAVLGLLNSSKAITGQNIIVDDGYSL
ncbi:SDR family oxidoreductase [Betaproteobacteria bacterium LSUCC0117]|nr:SDR family oxidoreductase [Betaproteobacteria bacterium LSUCC0117]